jgi:co-chaperonin GroES (HSP10)
MRILFDNLLVRELPKQEKAVNGIIIPSGSTAGGNSSEGQVFAAGPDCKSVTSGDIILFNSYIGQAFEHQGKPWRIVKEADVLVIFDKKATA